MAEHLATTEWNAIENLLLLQAVHKFGENKWDIISDVLSKHPLIVKILSRTSEFYTLQSCAAQFHKLRDNHMASTSTENDDTKKDSDFSTNMATNLHSELIESLSGSLTASRKNFEDIIQTILKNEKKVASEGCSKEKDSEQTMDEVSLDTVDVPAQTTNMKILKNFSEADHNNEILVKEEPELQPRSDILLVHDSLLKSEVKSSCDDVKHVETNVNEKESKIATVETVPSIEDACATSVTSSLPISSTLPSYTSMASSSSDHDDEDSKSHRRPARLSRASTPLKSGKSEEVDPQGQWKRAALSFLKETTRHRYAALFAHPVKAEDAPGYRSIIKRPIDLSTIRRRVEDGVVTMNIELQRDLALMFLNAMMFNKEDHEVYDMILEMKEYVDQQLDAFLDSDDLSTYTETPRSASSRRSSRSRLSYDGKDPSSEASGDDHPSSGESRVLRKRLSNSPASLHSTTQAIDSLTAAASVKRRRI